MPLRTSLVVTVAAALVLGTGTVATAQTAPADLSLSMSGLTASSAAGSSGIGDIGTESALGSLGIPEPPVLGGNPSVELGTVSIFRLDKNYGFITPWRGGPDIFFSGNDVICPVGVFAPSEVTFVREVLSNRTLARNVDCPAYYDPDWPY